MLNAQLYDELFHLCQTVIHSGFKWHSE